LQNENKENEENLQNDKENEEKIQNINKESESKHSALTFEVTEQSQTTEKTFITPSKVQTIVKENEKIFLIGNQKHNHHNQSYNEKSGYFFL